VDEAGILLRIRSMCLQPTISSGNGGISSIWINSSEIFVNMSDFSLSFALLDRAGVELCRI
jgi:hypothetical protein